MNRTPHPPVDPAILAPVRLAQWRRATARLLLLINTGKGAGHLAGEARSVQRQCQHLAKELQRMEREQFKRRQVEAFRGHCGMPP